MFNMIDFLEKKRDKGAHSKEEFDEFVSKTVSSEIPTYQLSAWLMAAYLNGLNQDEVVYFTDALARSGDIYSFPDDLKVVDKHSTGGVGDKTTLVLLPLAASCGAVVSKLSGRGLGFTGGTVDKLESIPGMRMSLSRDEFISQIRRIGCAVSGHSRQLAPAEGVFYKLRDVTGTVPLIALITASIVSKKLAGGASGYVFDVKCGSGAFMTNRDEAMSLARSLTDVSKRLGKKAVSVITAMEQPLGEWAGNASEVYEAVEVLKGKGPADTRELCTVLCGHMLVLAGKAGSADEGRKAAEKALESGIALKKFEELVTSQGGTADVVYRPLDVLPQAGKVYSIKSEKEGALSKLNARSIGRALRLLGGGRLAMDDVIDRSVSIRLVKKLGDRVKAGETVMELWYNDDVKLEEAIETLAGSWSVSETAEQPPLILDCVA